MHPMIERIVNSEKSPESKFGSIMNVIKELEGSTPEILTVSDYATAMRYVPSPSNPYYVAYIEEITKSLNSKIKINS